MNIESRLTKLETAAATLNPDGAVLARRMELVPHTEHKRWLAALTDTELAALLSEADRQWVANDWPPIDFKQFSDEQLDQILMMDEAQCRRILSGDFSEVRATQ